LPLGAKLRMGLRAFFEVFDFYGLYILCRGEVTSYGWCFLENIEDPTDATKNCFTDALWSHTHGRFWSHAVNCYTSYTAYIRVTYIT
jgi:hypothetical protein